MKQSWLRSVFPIAALFSFRMLGLFMLIPVFTIYATKLEGATSTLIGIALGSYGLSQGLLQIPFGILSDRFGRKPIITLGLVLFAIGSLVGALSDSIFGMIIARVLQGTGAIGSVLIALLADLTPDESRTKAMAVIGMTIGMSFTLSMVISPAITNHFGLAGIFYFTAFMATAGLLLLHLVIPTPKKEPFHIDSEANPALLSKVMSNHHLQRLDLGIFCQHFILTATFFAIPMILQEQIKQGNLTQSWHFYLPLMLVSFVFMIPFIIIAEKKQKVKPLFLSAVLITALGQLTLALTYQHWISLCAIMFFYFIAFNFLEASLPSLVSKQAGLEFKGTAMGVYSSSQFLGIFAGGALAGVVFQFLGNQGLFITNACVGFIWFSISLFMRPNVYQTTLIINYPHTLTDESQLITKLLNLPGVNKVTSAQNEGVIYILINKETYQSGSAEKAIDK